MERFGKGFLLFAVVMNVAAIVCLVFDSQKLRDEVKEVHEVRVQLPQEFLQEVANQVAERTTVAAHKRLNPCLSGVEVGLNDLLLGMTNRAGMAMAQLQRSLEDVPNLVHEQLKPCLPKVEREMCEALLGMTNRAELVMVLMRQSFEGMSEEIARLRQKEERDRHARIECARSAYALYQKNNTNESAILYLQIAIRKDPSCLAYIKALESVVKEQSFDPGLAQLYQEMLSYCLNEATMECCEELCRMVLDFRSAFARNEETLAYQSRSDSEAHRTQIEEELLNKPLISGFSQAAQKRACERIALIEKLMSVSEDFDESKCKGDLDQAKMVCKIIDMGVRIRELLAMAKVEIQNIEGQSPDDTVALQEQLSALGGMSVSQPIALAKQVVRPLFGVDLSHLPDEFASSCRAQSNLLAEEVQGIARMVEELKVAKILDCVNKIGETIPEQMRTTFTDRLKVLSCQAKVIAEYVGTIEDPGVARAVLDRQTTIVEQSKENQKKRLDAYQQYAYVELKKLASEMKRYKKDLWTTAKKKKNAAERLLKRLMLIDPVLLSPQIHEVYQYEYDKLLEDYNIWVEDKMAYEQKAEFMHELEKIEKTKLETF